MRFFLGIAFSLLTTILFAQNNGIVFTENKSQYPSNVLYKSDLLGGSLFLEEECLTYVFHTDKTNTFPSFNKSNVHKPFENDTSTIYHAYKVHFVNYNTSCKITAENPIDGYENSYKGNDPKKWSTHIMSYQKIIYHELWNGIDLVIYQNGSILKYDFIIRPGANPNVIKLRYEGIDSVKITKDDIVLKTSINEVIEKKPVSYQYSKKGRDSVQTFYVLDDEAKTLSYRIYKYDPKRTLFIDPELIFSTYTGSISDNWGFTATFDNEGNVYSGGIVVNDGNIYPVSLGSFQQKNGGLWDIGIIKYDPTGTKRLYATYLGGMHVDMPQSLVVNSKNELIVFGTTSSPDFPVKNAYDNTFNGGQSIVYDNLSFWGGLDLFVAKISPDGSNLIASTFIGGSQNDGLNYDNDIPDSLIESGNDSLYYNYGDGARGEVIVDKSDNVYIGTCTFSPDFPIVGGFQSKAKGKEEGVVVKLSPNLSSIIWSSYMGGSADDAIYSIDVDTSNNVYITGGTNSNDLTTTSNTLHPNRLGGSADAFVTKIKNDGSAIEESTYWGSGNYDQAYFVRVDKNKHVYIYGQTRATGNTLLINATYGQPNSGQFISKFSNTLDTVIWSTTFGTGINQPNISPTAMSVDVCNRVYLAGVGREWPEEISLKDMKYDPFTGFYKYGQDWDNIKGTKNMPISSDAYQKYTDGQDFYFMVIDDKASMLDYATFFGEQGSYIYRDLNTGKDWYFSGCVKGGNDHVDGGTSRFDKVGNIYQSACASCGGCNSFPTYPKPGAWSNYNKSKNCNNATVVFRIHRDQMQANFIPKINPCNPYSVTFTNTSVIIDTTNVKYTWDFGDSTSKSTVRSPQHTYAKKGTYIVTLTIKDGSSCNFLDSVKYPITIIDTTGTIALNALNICEGDSIALGKVFPDDGTITYLWTPATGLSSDTVANPYARPKATITYTVVVRQNGCFQTYSQTVNVFNSIFSVAIKQISGGSNNQVCYGEHTKLRIQMAEPARRIIWSFNRNFIPQITSLPDSTIDIIVTGDTMVYVQAVGKYCGTISTDSIRLTVIKPAFSKANDTTICKGSLATLRVINTNSAVPLLFNWTPASIIVSGQGTETVTVKPTISSFINVAGTSVEGCVLSQQFIVSVDELLFDSAKLSNISCHNKNDASITFIPNGIPPYTYIWNDGNGKENTRDSLQAGIYTITISDNLGCTNVDTFTVINPEQLVAVSSVHPSTCHLVCNGSMYSVASGGVKPYRYKWTTSDTTFYIMNKCPGYYGAMITDAHGCSVDVKDSIILKEQLPELHATADITKLYRTQKTTITAISNPPDTISYHWVPESGLDDPNSAKTVVHPDSTTTYFVYATDQFGCSNIDSVTIYVKDFKCEAPYVYIPNAFSPNDDKINDVLFVESKVIDKLYFAVYTRWGEKIFETNDITKGWDGTYKGAKLDPAVFVYYIDATCINQMKYQKKGNISLLR